MAQESGVIVEMWKSESMLRSRHLGCIHKIFWLWSERHTWLLAGTKAGLPVLPGVFYKKSLNVARIQNSPGLYLTTSRLPLQTLHSVAVNHERAAFAILWSGSIIFGSVNGYFPCLWTPGISRTPLRATRWRQILKTTLQGMFKSSTG